MLLLTNCSHWSKGVAHQYCVCTVHTYIYIMDTPAITSYILYHVDTLAHGMVQEYYNLNIAQQACCYPGPISIIRRAGDEMMAE